MWSHPLAGGLGTLAPENVSWWSSTAEAQALDSETCTAGYTYIHGDQRSIAAAYYSEEYPLHFIPVR